MREYLIVLIIATCYHRHHTKFSILRRKSLIAAAWRILLDQSAVEWAKQVNPTHDSIDSSQPYLSLLNLNN